MTDKNKKMDLAPQYFTAEKTSDVFKEVTFTYGEKQWIGLLPLFLEKQGLDQTEEEFKNLIEENYNHLNPKNKKQWIIDSDNKWPEDKKKTATYKVLKALYSGVWECRVCGPVPSVNPQPAARLRDLKKKGYIIGSKRRTCSSCEKKTMHDILVMLPDIEARFIQGNELRAPLSEKLKEKIKKTLGMKDVCFNVKRTEIELVVDHKYPSQRWGELESPNPNNMSTANIEKKFQLLTNQTNMWKSRYCDRCVKDGKRGDFMGIEWYYQGDENWAGATEHDEKGCVGCPWYDTQKWKDELNELINKD